MLTDGLSHLLQQGSQVHRTLELYHPGTGFRPNVPAILKARYDAFIYIDESKAIHPLHLHPDPKKTPETYPFED